MLVVLGAMIVSAVVGYCVGRFSARAYYALSGRPLSELVLAAIYLFVHLGVSLGTLVVVEIRQRICITCYRSSKPGSSHPAKCDRR